MDDQQLEHLARCAAEWADTEVEGLCDDALAGHTDSAILEQIVLESERYTDWMERGRSRGWEARS